MSVVKFYLERAECAEQYVKKHKTHTATIIIAGIVESFLPYSVLSPYIDGKHKDYGDFLILLKKTEALLETKCRQDCDAEILKQKKLQFESVLKMLNVRLSSDESTSDDTECSCDDCHNGTISTFGCSDGCRVARTRD